jgi:hypothetical protein
MAGLYCTHPADLRDVRLETVLINSEWNHAEVIITEKIPDKPLSQQFIRKNGRP